MTVGIMGGTLNPVHSGHIRVALEVRDALHLDDCLLLPAGDPPHKTLQVSKYDRLNMVKAAAEASGLTACDLEVEREGTTYTVDTLNELHRRYPKTEWVYIIGADTLEVLDTWRNFSEVATLCTFAAVDRPGYTAESAKQAANRLTETYGARIMLTSIMGPELSSTEIREKVCRGESISGMVPEAVESYIRDHGIYLCDFTETQVLEMLKKSIKPGRYIHSLGVAETAERLAPRYGIAPARARLAGLLHDCAKSMDKDEMIRLVTERVPDIDALELQMEPVLHGPAGSVVAHDVYGVRDCEILSAIRNHTRGKGNMTALETLIFLADYIEPNRKPFEGLERVRKMAEEDIFKAAAEAARMSSEHVIRNGGKAHPRTKEMFESIPN
ncbi:MAG: nicotinate-nucleotide adenylyltransferase [Clostridia bacterium]|nr:nicotinate-nucleotide adenylyltransferase [Clostridia bacterium]